MCRWRWRSPGLAPGSSSRPGRCPGSRHRLCEVIAAGPDHAVGTTRRRETMTTHKTGTHDEWLAARLELLQAEKELTRRSDDVARQRQELPWVRIGKDYRFETDGGSA